jgi:hypothetical protein
MHKYIVKLVVEVEVEAFNLDDATDYIGDIFNIDDEIKKVSISSIKEKK